MRTFLEFLSVFQRSRCVVGGIFKMICYFHNELQLYQADSKHNPCRVYVPIKTELVANMNGIFHERFLYTLLYMYV